MKKCYRFNMVEIALAIVVIAIGLSAILVLFPVGIKATRSAVEENVVPDIASVVVNFVRGEYLKNWDTARSTFPTMSENGKTPAGETTPTFDEVVFGSAATGELKKSSTSGVYQYYRATNDSDGNTVDEFTATVQIWRPSSTDLTADDKEGNCPLYLPDMYVKDETLKTAPNISYDSGEGNSDLSAHPKLSSGDTNTSIFEKFADSVLVEISYGDVKKTFRVDLYNPSYEIKAAP